MDSRNNISAAGVAVSWRSLLWCLLLPAANLLLPPSAPAQPSAAQEYEVKAGFLVKFGESRRFLFYFAQAGP